MSGIMSEQYRMVAYKAGATYADKPDATDTLKQKRLAIREVRREVKRLGVGAHGAVYAGPTLTSLVYQVRAAHDDAGTGVKLIVEEL